MVADPAGSLHEARLPLREYLSLVATTNFYQRVRKTMHDFYSDRVNRALLTPP